MDALFLSLLPFVAAGLLLWLHRRGKELRTQEATPTNRAAPHYRRAQSLLTPCEAHFYHALTDALPPGYSVQCKVRLADILLSASGDMSAFRQVSQKHTDFCVCRAVDLRPMLCIELDDRSHSRPDRQARDGFVNAAYASAGLPLVHIVVQHDYNAHYLRSLLCPHLPA